MIDRIRRAKPSPAIVLSIVALVFACTSSAVAARGLISGADVKKGSLTGANIKKRSLSGAHIKKNSLTGAHIKNGSIRGYDIANGSLNLVDLSAKAKRKLQGSTGPAGPQGPKGEPGADGKDGARGPQGPAGPALSTVGHLLYVDNGADETSMVTYTLDKPIKLSEFDLTFFQELVHGSGSYGASVVLGVDSNGDGKYDRNDGDTYVAMDGDDPAHTKVDAPNVPHWWSPGGDGNDANCYSKLQTLVAKCEGVKLKANDLVRVVRFTLGSSGAWKDIAVRVTAPSLAGATVTAG